MVQAASVEFYNVMAVRSAVAFYRHRTCIVSLLHGIDHKVFLSIRNRIY